MINKGAIYIFLLQYIRMSLYQQKIDRTNTLSRILGIRQSSQLNKSSSQLNKSSSQLNKSSSPDIDLISNLKERVHTDNPLMRLCIEDYELMCRNNMVFNMMIKVLDTDKKRLTKICKKIDILKEYINSSPESIKNKMKEYKTPILNLPEELRVIVFEQYEKILKLVLRDWIPIDKLSWKNLSGNPNAIKLLDANPDKIDWHYLSGNPNGFDLIKKYVIGNKEQEDKISWHILSLNSKAAIKLLETKILEDDSSTSWYLLARNPDAISIIRKYPNKIDWNAISKNSNAIDILRKKWEEEKILIKTKHPIYTYLKLHHIVSWDLLSGNTGALDLLREKIQMEKDMPPDEYKLLSYKERIDWESLSGNPETVELLEENRDKIVWQNLSNNSNPKAIQLLKERVEYEKRLKRRYRLKLSNKINWTLLSSNPNAIEILAANKKKINWDVLSGNPNAIDILEANQDKINWEILSLNPSIFFLR